MSESEKPFDWNDFLPRYRPLGLPVWVPKGAIARLAEQIAIAIRVHASDQNGLKILAPVNYPALPDIAREAMRQVCGASHVVEQGEPDPDLGPYAVIFRPPNEEETNG